MELKGTNPLGLYTLKDGAAATENYLAAIDADGYVQNAADAAGLRVTGYFFEVDADGNCQVRDGILGFDISADHPLTRGDRGKIVYVEDGKTVSADPGVNAVKAGRLVDVYDGSAFVDCRPTKDGEDGAAGADGADGADGAAGSVPGGSYPVVQADDDAGTKTIATGLASVTTFIVQILRAGVDVTGDAVLSKADGNITIADGAANYALTADDVINWIAVGPAA